MGGNIRGERQGGMGMVAEANIEHYQQAAGHAITHQCKAEAGSGLSDHWRQWVGRTSIRFLVTALIQPPRKRRHGKTSACGPSESMTASSRSRSKGAVEIGCHMVGDSCPDEPWRLDLDQGSEDYGCEFRTPPDHARQPTARSGRLPGTRRSPRLDRQLHLRQRSVLPSSDAVRVPP